MYGFWPAHSEGDDIVIERPGDVQLASAPKKKRKRPAPNVASVASPTTRFREYLATIRTGLTRDPLLVLNAVLPQSNSFSVEAIFEIVTAKKVARAAVVKTLGHLVAAGLVTQDGESYRVAPEPVVVQTMEDQSAPTSDPATRAPRTAAVFPQLRQQWERPGQKDFRSLADYIAPQGSGRQDFIGAFAVTAGHGCDELAKQFDADHDEYNSIMTKALADRLAEAFAEYIHAEARQAWGFGQGEGLSQAEIIEEKYRGIRPAYGYPACPDHTRKRQLFDLLSAEKHTGITLTESYAMWPAASVSGLLFAHPAARYFSIDRITKDQVESYATRTGQTVAEVERWLMPNLGY